MTNKEIIVTFIYIMILVIGGIILTPINEYVAAIFVWGGYALWMIQPKWFVKLLRFVMRSK